MVRSEGRRVGKGRRSRRPREIARCLECRHAFLCSCLLCSAVRIFFSSRRRHTRCLSDWSSDVCSSDLTHRQDACATLKKLQVPHETGLVNRISQIANEIYFIRSNVFCKICQSFRQAQMNVTKAIVIHCRWEGRRRRRGFLTISGAVSQLMLCFGDSFMNQPGAMSAQKGADQPLPKGKPSSDISATAAAPAVPDYELLRRIGHGAYGDVWLARSQATGVLRAAKIVWRHTFEDEKPFRREFEGIQHFERISREHPSQLALFHIGRNEPGGYFYYVMELADQAEPGPNAEERTAAYGIAHPDVNSYIPHMLRADLAKGRLAAAKVLEIGLALSEALSHLHSHGLVHRDVKPSNVIFVNGRPKLADIGLVTDASDQCSIVGTEGYLPPEGPGTPQADIFAFGKVLYEAATGLDRREFPKLSDDLRSWPDAAQVFELNEIILKACAQDAKSRYQTRSEDRR